MKTAEPIPTSFQWAMRQGFLPALSDRALCALERGLRTNDPAFVQGTTTTPLPIPENNDQPVEGACLICFPGWQAEDLETVGELDEYFAKMCAEIDRRLGEPTGCRYLTNVWDSNDLCDMIPLALVEVRGEMQRRGLRVAA